MTAAGFPGVPSTGLRTMTTGSRPMPMMSGARPSHLADQPATVFGNSSGAIGAPEVLTRYPERVQTVVAHEPSAVSGLSDAAKWWAFFDRIYDSSRKHGIPTAMHQFVSMAVGKRRASGDRACDDTAGKRVHQGERCVLDRTRVAPVSALELDLAALAALAGQLVLVGGRDAQDKVPYQSASALARQLGLTLVDVPGGHIGFMTSPAEFAAALIDALKD